MDSLPRACTQERTLNQLHPLRYVVWGRRFDIFLESSCEALRGLGSRVLGVAWRRSGIAFRAVSRDASLIFVPRSVFEFNGWMDIILLYVINHCVVRVWLLDLVDEGWFVLLAYRMWSIMYLCYPSCFLVLATRNICISSCDHQ